MNLRHAIERPEYLFRPSQILRRLRCELRSASGKYETIRLPWGLPIRIQPAEQIGSSIRRLGIHELTTCECVGRLIEPGDLVIDAGANIGQMTSLMALRAGREGQVIAFEPHPIVGNELEHNVAGWQRDPRHAPITVQHAALSNCQGAAQLTIPDWFDANHGIAFLAGSRSWNGHTKSCQVPATVLDASVPTARQVGLLKIDVEGHELKVLEGAHRLLAAGLIRDIVFEEIHTPPSPAMLLLEAAGYKLYRLEGKFFGPVLRPLSAPPADSVKDSTNYLATRDAQRALKRISKHGWAVYSGKWPR